MSLSQCERDGEAKARKLSTALGHLESTAMAKMPMKGLGSVCEWGILDKACKKTGAVHHCKGEAWACPALSERSTALLCRRGHDVLRDQLPSKEEHVILVRLSPVQRALYTEFMKRFREAGNTGWLGLNPLKAFCVCCKVRPLPCLRPFFFLLFVLPYIVKTQQLSQIWDGRMDG